MRPTIVALVPFFVFSLAAAQDSGTAPHADSGTATHANHWLIEAGTESGLPEIRANDNRTAAGILRGDTLDVSLEVVLGDFRPETPDGPGLRLLAFAESAEAPSIPAPMIRVRQGTVIRARVHNAVGDSALHVFGLHTRPAESIDSLIVEPGAIGEIVFDAGEPGTYLYRARLGGRFRNPGVERDVLSGAFVVDPVGGSPADRVFVMNIWGQVDSTVAPTRYLEALTINGLSWPFTERIQPSVGDTLRWRVINASGRNHPMHLHGFFYNVVSRGDILSDDRYDEEDYRLVVTESMRRRTTMAMEWVPTRPGNWLFHCHLSFHVSPEIRLPRPEAEGSVHAEHGKPHMAGLVLGIEVQPGPTDLVWKGEPRRFTLYANEYPADSTTKYGFALAPDFAPDSVHLRTPGPVLLLKQHQPTYVTVTNNMSIPTGVHWHGLELDSWADGVPGWSASDGKTSPVIHPGESFTYKLASMRPGTFIYHSHLDDVHQLTGGLYGPLVVLPEIDDFDPKQDHVAIVGWRTPNPQSMGDAELNGLTEQPVQYATVGEQHRIRVINIAPAGMIMARMTKEEEPVPLTAIAKDGADLPAHQQVPVEVTPRLGVGETADFVFAPTEPGSYELMIGYGPRASWRQKWEVTDG